MPADPSIPIRRRNRPSTQLGDVLHRLFVTEKLNNWLGWLIMAGVATVFGYLIAEKTVMGLSLFGLVFGLSVFIACVINTEAGLYINIAYSFFASQFSRYLFHDEFPVGVVTDILILATFLSLLFKTQFLKAKLEQFARSPVVIGILLLILYLFLELFNPNNPSFDGWFQTFRRFLDSVFLLFIAYNVFTDYARVRRFINVLFAFCVMTAIYGCIQQWHGLFDFELAWVHADEVRFGLYFIMGNFRKFSTMSDPTAFGIAMASSSILFMIIAWHERRLKTKLIYGAGIVLMLLAMAYSGTRTANIMVTGGLVMYILLTLDKKTSRIFAFCMTLVFLFFMYGPYVNSTIIRFRTSFIGNKDESYKVREMNRAKIQPYIYEHPIGGGVGTTGASGLRFNKNHELAGFPPDSGYLRKALETGWIGLAIVCILYFTILRYGVRRYFRSRSNKLKVLCAACVSSIFAFYIAEFGQEAIGQITDIVIYYPLIAILLRVEYFKGYQLGSGNRGDEEW